MFLLIGGHVVFHIVTCYLLNAASILEWAVERLQWTRAAVIRHGSTSDTSHTTPVGAVQTALWTLRVVISVWKMCSEFVATILFIFYLSSNGCVCILVATVFALIRSIVAFFLQVGLEVLASHSLPTSRFPVGAVKSL